MSKCFSQFLALLLFVSYLFSPHDQKWSIADEPQAITYQQLLSFVELEVKEEKLLKMLAESPTKFTLGEDQIAKLKAAGASDKLLAALNRNPTTSLEQTSDIRDFVIVLDASASMRDEAEKGISKWDSAKKAAADLIRSIPNSRRLAFIVYGNDITKRCKSIELIRPLESIDDSGKSALIKRIDTISPAADTPIGAALNLARSLVANSNMLTKVILITDGLESCKGDPEGEASQLAALTHMQGGVDVIGYGLKQDEIAQVEKIARSGRGKFYNAGNVGTLRESVAAVERTITKKTVAISSTPTDPDLSKMFIIIDRKYSWEPGLQIEPIVNGTSLGQFSSKTFKSVGQLLKKGENTIEFRTTAMQKTPEENAMIVSIGPAKVDVGGDSIRMDRVLWSYGNDSDWKFIKSDEKFVYKMNPNAVESKVIAKLMIDGLQCETSLGHGDIVLEAKYDYSWWSPKTASVYINGQPLSSVMNSNRTMVINSMLRPGSNEIKVICRGVDNSLAEDNELTLTVGKCKFNPSNDSYSMTPIESRKVSDGLIRNDDNEFVNKENPSLDYYEQTFTVEIDKIPNAPK
jgi:Mg-chelatase subunit ChlD